MQRANTHLRVYCADPGEQPIGFEPSRAINTNGASYHFFRSFKSSGRIFNLHAACSKWRHLQASDEPVMNLNFAFACMIVVSFTIALVHT
jgi:hypothetical protein